MHCATKERIVYRPLFLYVPHLEMASRMKAVEETYDKFITLDDLPKVLSEFKKLCSLLEITPKQFPSFFNEFRRKPAIFCYGKANRALAQIWEAAKRRGYVADPKTSTNDVKITDDASPDDEYIMNDKPQPCIKRKVLIVGSGPTGLRMAIECQLLGAQVVVVEQRDNFTRYNIAYMWDKARTDLQELGISHFYNNFCSGAYNTISIRMLQFILLKLALILGVRFYYGVECVNIIEPSEGCGWRAEVNPSNPEISNFEFDVFVDSSGKKNSVYPIAVIERPEQKTRTMIALVANFVYNGKQDEMYDQIAGVSEHRTDKHIKSLTDEEMEVENLVYYRRETHYFIMTLKKGALKKHNLIYEEYPKLRQSLAPNNINKTSVEKLALKVANMVTERKAATISEDNRDKLNTFVITEHGETDTSLFYYKASTQAGNSSRILERNGKMLLTFLTGDSLILPFWPSGTGIIKGFMSVLDACWVMKLWSLNENRITPLQILGTKEYLYKHLKGLNDNSHLIKPKKAGSVLDPWRRYEKNVDLKTNHAEIRQLYDTDVDFKGKQIEESSFFEVYSSKSSDKNYALDVILDWYIELLSMLDITVVDFTTSWRSGIALLAVICLWEPTLVDWLSLSDDNKKNVQRAINILALKFGIPPTLTAEKIVALEDEDVPLMARYLNKILNVITSSYKDLIVEITKLHLVHDGQPRPPGICLPEAENIKEQLGPDIVRNIMARMQKSVPEDLAKEQAPDVIEEIANVEENLEKEIAEAVRPLQSPPRQIVPLSADSTTELFKETTGTESVTEDKVSVGNLETGLAASQASKSELKLSDQLEEQEKAKDDKMSVERLTKVEESLQMTDDKILVGMDEGVKDVSEELLLKRRPEEDKTQELHLQNLSNLAKSDSLPNLKLLTSSEECCIACGKLIFSAVQLVISNGYHIHKKCLKCWGCNRDLSEEIYNFDSVTNKFYCEHHDVCREEENVTSELRQESEYETDESMPDRDHMKQNERIEPEILEGEPDSISILQKSGESLAALDSEAKLVAVQWLQQNPDKLNAVLQDPDVQNVLIMAALKNPEIEDGLVRELGFNPMESVPFAEEKEPVELLQTINLPDVDIEKVDGKSETSKEMMTDVEEIQKPSKPEAITLDTVENQKSLNEEIIRSLQRTYSWPHNKKMKPSQYCHFCSKNVFVTERVIVKKTKAISFHRQCLKCQECHRMLTMTTYHYDETLEIFTCGAHDTTETKDVQEVRGTEELKAPSKWKLARMTLRLIGLLRKKETTKKDEEKVDSVKDKEDLYLMW